MARWSYKNGYYAEGVGSYHSLIPNAAKHFELSVEGTGASNLDKIVEALSKGSVSHSNHEKRPFYKLRTLHSTKESNRIR